MSRREPASPPASRSALGRSAEAAAAAWLQSAGWAIAARNWRRGPGELDIVAVKGGELAFVEVKRVDAWGLESLAGSVGPEKRRRIVETAKLFLAAHREFNRMNARFDVIAVSDETVSAHLEHAFAEST